MEILNKTRTPIGGAKTREGRSAVEADSPPSVFSAVPKNGASQLPSHREADRLQNVAAGVPDFDTPVAGPLRHDGLVAPRPPGRSADLQLDIGSFDITLDPNVVHRSSLSRSLDAGPGVKPLDAGGEGHGSARRRPVDNHGGYGRFRHCEATLRRHCLRSE